MRGFFEDGATVALFRRGVMSKVIGPSWVRSWVVMGRQSH